MRVLDKKNILTNSLKGSYSPPADMVDVNNIFCSRQKASNVFFLHAEIREISLIRYLRTQLKGKKSALENQYNCGIVKKAFFL